MHFNSRLGEGGLVGGTKDHELELGKDSLVGEKKLGSFQSYFPPEGLSRQSVWERN